MDRDVIERVARVSRINLTEEELLEFKEDLEDILGYFEILDSAPVSGNETVAVGILREDVPRSDIESKELLKDMKTYEGYVRGPRLS